MESFYEDYIGSSGQHIMKGTYKFAVENYRYLCILFPTEKKQGWLLQRSMPNLNASFFFLDHFHSILFTNIE